MKILHIYKSFSGGGAEKYLKQTMNYFNKKHQVDALVVNNKNEKETIVYSENSKVIKMPLSFEFDSAKLSFSYIIKLNQMSKKYDVFHFHYPNPIGELSWLLNLHSNVKTLVTFHNDVAKEKKFSSIYNKLMYYYFKKIDKIIVTSENLAKTSNVLKQFENKIEVIPLGIDFEKYRTNKKYKKTNKVEILFVGRLAPVKGLSYLIDAVSKLKNEQFVLNIVGKGPLKDELRKQINKNNLNDKINILGFVSNEKLKKLYSTADIFVLPSVYRGEGFGYVLLEAMINETACISTELGTGTSFVNLNNKSGYVVEPRNSIELANKISQLINNPKILSSFKENSKKRVKDNFGLNKMLLETEKIYNDLTKQRMN